ncbi:MAG: DUF1697 domain-containing protein [Candidatus Eisenbacteria bacterium]
MAIHVALLRGINVGSAKRIAMFDLRALFEDLGYRDVRTLLNSGNVVFAATASGSPGPRIERALVGALGVPSRVITLGAGALAAVVSKNPLVALADPPSRLLVSFLAAPDARRLLASLARLDWGEERLAAGPGVAYAWCPGGILESPVQKALGKVFGDGMTTRNWTTVLKLHVLASSPAPGMPTRGQSGPSKPSTPGRPGPSKGRKR